MRHAPETAHPGHRVRSDVSCDGPADSPADNPDCKAEEAAFERQEGGDTYLRTLLIHGARSVLRYAVGKTAAQSQWLQELIARRGYNRAAVALANKNARVIQVLRSRDVPYHPSAAVH